MKISDNIILSVNNAHANNYTVNSYANIHMELSTCRQK